MSDARLSRTYFALTVATGGLGVMASAEGDAFAASISFSLMSVVGTLWVVPRVARVIGRGLHERLSRHGWSRPERIKAEAALSPAVLMEPEVLPTSRTMGYAAQAARSVEFTRRRGGSESEIEMRDDNRRKMLLMAARDMDRSKEDRDIRSSFVRLQSYARHTELEAQLTLFLRAVTAWMMRKQHFDATTRAEGQHILSILSEHCDRMAEDRALLESDEACMTLATALKARTPQIQSAADTIILENQRRLMSNLGDLSDHLGDLQRRLEDQSFRGSGAQTRPHVPCKEAL